MDRNQSMTIYLAIVQSVHLADIIINRILSALYIEYDQEHVICLIHMPNNVYPLYLSNFCSVYLLAWHAPVHILYIPSSNHCLLFTTHAHTVAFYFALVTKLCHLMQVRP